jgi:hypothetical protein
MDLRNPPSGTSLAAPLELLLVVSTSELFLGDRTMMIAIMMVADTAVGLPLDIDAGIELEPALSFEYLNPQL